MKIAQVIIGYHERIGGYGRHVNLITEELKRRGHDVTIISTKFSPGEYKKESGVVRLWNTPLLKITPSLLTHLLSNDYDIVHVFGYPSFQPFITCLAKEFKKFPLIFTPHYHPFGYKPAPLRKLFDLTFGNYALKKPDYVIATTDYEKRMLRRRGVKKISVILNPLKTDKLRKIKGFKKKYGIKKDFILFVGRIEKDKGLQYLIPAVKGLPITLAVVGKNFGHKSKLPEQNNVLFTGSVSQEDLMSAYTECKFLVLPSKYESFGIVLIEAMHYSKPVIATRTGPVPSIVKDSGLLIRYSDINSLRDSIKKLLNDNKLRQLMGREAYRSSLIYDVKNVVDKLLIIYNEVLKKK